MEPNYAKRRQTLRTVMLRTQAELSDRKRFDMGLWFCKSSDANNRCKTVACALGWFANSPEAKADKWEVNDIQTPGFPDPAGLFFEGTYAASVYFGISHGDAIYLFLPNSYDSCLEEDITIDDFLAHLDHIEGS